MAQVKSGHKILSGINYASYNLRGQVKQMAGVM
ncbi:hypothetical protein EL79_5150 [Escherichia coli]|nr:hypothetical protein EL79_5150 [Escherichia coli]